MTYQEATTEQILSWLNSARQKLMLAEYAERDWGRYTNEASLVISDCSTELTKRAVAHKTHKPTMSETL